MQGCLSAFSKADGEYWESLSRKRDQESVERAAGGSRPIDEELYRRWRESLERAVERVGAEEEQASRWRANVSRFAAYKAWWCTQELKKAAEDGRSGEELIGILHRYNRWQAAEYNTAVARARTGKQWAEWDDPERRRLFPRIKWLPSRSATPREEHLPFYNRVWPKEDPFWQYNQPGSLWNCKCDWEETDEEETEGNPRRRIVKPGLDENPAGGKIFTDSAPYIEKAPKTDAFRKDLNSVGVSEMRHKTLPETKAQTEIGEVQIGRWHYNEAAKTNTHNDCYYLKNEVAQHLDYYLPKFDYDGTEPIDNHNSKKSKAGKRKRHGIQMHKFTKEMYGYTFVVKVIEMKNGELKAWTTYIK